jgi:hypothetical protein
LPSIGKYNETYFRNHPEEADKDGVLYGIVLVNKKTFERECIKVGIASGKDWRHVIKRSGGFKGYDIRIQKNLVRYSLSCVDSRTIPTRNLPT